MINFFKWKHWYPNHFLQIDNHALQSLQCQVTWNYTYSPFNLLSDIWSKTRNYTYSPFNQLSDIWSKTGNYTYSPFNQLSDIWSKTRNYTYSPFNQLSDIWSKTRNKRNQNILKYFLRWLNTSTIIWKCSVLKTFDILNKNS